MKVHFKPLVLLVARPQLVQSGVAGLLAEYGLPPSGWARHEDAPGDQLPELMGRLCYGSFGARQGRVGAAKYIGNILAQGHGSVLEHACWSFVVCRASRGFTHQAVRHRAGFAFSQESQHFIRYSGDGEPGAPEAALCLYGLGGDEASEAEAACKAAINAYAELWKAIRDYFPDGSPGKKEACAAARGILPNAMESRLGFTANARALRHFVETRGAAGNVPEIMEVARQVLAIMTREAPATFADVRLQADGSIYSAYRKV